MLRGRVLGQAQKRSVKRVPDRKARLKKEKKGKKDAHEGREGEERRARTRKGQLVFIFMTMNEVNSESSEKAL